ncbi:hypothetical protein GGR56DRAFT_95162 [Xylariaceae sp. FL0804]|nr:hypothetical protein GGR56DRAFT_95162 [Xylariaceae sp. FL0804]
MWKHGGIGWLATEDGTCIATLQPGLLGVRPVVHHGLISPLPEGIGATKVLAGCRQCTVQRTREGRGARRCRVWRWLFFPRTILPAPPWGLVIRATPFCGRSPRLAPCRAAASPIQRSREAWMTAWKRKDLCPTNSGLFETTRKKALAAFLLEKKHRTEKRAQHGVGQEWTPDGALYGARRYRAGESHAAVPRHSQPVWSAGRVAGTCLAGQIPSKREESLFRPVSGLTRLTGKYGSMTTGVRNGCLWSPCSAGLVDDSCSCEPGRDLHSA